MPARLAKKRVDPDAILIGSLGCHDGGYARAKKLDPKHLSRIGKHGAKIRWNSK